MKTTNLSILFATSVAMTLGGCASAEIQSAILKNSLNSLTSRDALRGSASALPAAMPALTNPATIGVMGATAAMEAHQTKKNLEALDRLQALGNKEAMQKEMLRRYNQTHNTNYKSFEELQKALDSR